MLQAQSTTQGYIQVSYPVDTPTDKKLRHQRNKRFLMCAQHTQPTSHQPASHEEIWRPKGMRPDTKPEPPNISPKIPSKNIHMMENPDHDSNSCSSLGSIIQNMFEDARLSGTMPSTSNQETVNITLLSLLVPNIGEHPPPPPNQKDKVWSWPNHWRNSTLASIWWQKKSTSVHTDPVGPLKSFLPKHLLVGRKRWERPHKQGGLPTS